LPLNHGAALYYLFKNGKKLNKHLKLEKLSHIIRSLNRQHKFCLPNPPAQAERVGRGGYFLGQSMKLIAMIVYPQHYLGITAIPVIIKSVINQRATVY